MSLYPITAELLVKAHRQREQELERRAAIVRALAASVPETPGATDRALMTAGDALIALGGWLKARASLPPAALGVGRRVYQ